MNFKQELNEQMKNWETIDVNKYRRENYVIMTTGAEWIIIKDGYGRLSNTYKNMINAFKFVNRKLDK